MTEQEEALADHLLARIETATGEFPRRDGALATLIAEILAATNGLPSLHSMKSGLGAWVTTVHLRLWSITA